MKYALTLQEIIPIKLNGTFLVIGKISSIYLDAAIVLADGFLHLDKADTICCNGADGYYTTDSLGRCSYAKPDEALRKIG